MSKFSPGSFIWVRDPGDHRELDKLTIISYSEGLGVMEVESPEVGNFRLVVDSKTDDVWYPVFGKGEISQKPFSLGPGYMMIGDAIYSRADHRVTAAA